MESRVTITRDGEIHVTVTGVNERFRIGEIEGPASLMTNDAASPVPTTEPKKRRSYKRKKISRKNRRK